MQYACTCIVETVRVRKMCTQRVFFLHCATVLPLIHFNIKTSSNFPIKFGVRLFFFPTFSCWEVFVIRLRHTHTQPRLNIAASYIVTMYVCVCVCAACNSSSASLPSTHSNRTTHSNCKRHNILLPHHFDVVYGRQYAYFVWDFQCVSRHVCARTSYKSHAHKLLVRTLCEYFTQICFFSSFTSSWIQ